MEENVALDTSKQKKFVKSIKGIKKLIEKAKDVPETDTPKTKEGKKPKRKRPDRGLVYLSHIPHGFYEHEMTEYFKQFGAVSNVRVIKSKRTGNSKGFAFVEFKQPAVAEIVAETMNNYLMGKRLIKAAYIPPEKQRPRAMRKHWSRLNNPGRTARLAQKKAHNENKDEAGELARARKTLSVFKKNMKKLSDLGIEYDFFTPVDIPEALKSSQKPVEAESNLKSKQSAVQKEIKQNKKDKIKSETNKPVPAQKDEKKVDSKKDKNKSEPAVNKKEQKQKEQKLKDAGVKLPQNFIELQADNADSDSSVDFDSDDYTKALESDSDVESGSESDEFEITGSEDSDSQVDESEEEQVIDLPKNKGKRGPVPPVQKQNVKPKLNEKAQKQGQVKQMVPVQQKGPKAPEQGKRKAPQKNAVNPKKPKFEKQHKQLKKQFKKKK